LNFFRILISVVFSTICSFSQTTTPQPTLTFKTITTNDGLSNRVVRNIAQDDDGFIWIGTEDGLNRLDGYRIHNYFYNSKLKNGLPNNSISTLHSSGSKLWIGTTSGVCFYNTKTKQFQSIDTEHTTQLHNDFEAHFITLKEITWMIGTENLYRYKNGKTTSLPYTIPKEYLITKGGSLKRYFDIITDEKQTIWGNFGRYLVELNASDLSIKKGIIIGDKNHDGITRLVAQKNYIWASTWGNGLIRLNTKTNRQESVQLKAEIIHNIALCDSSWLIAGTNLGYAIINTKTLEAKEYFLPQEIYNVFVDRDQTVWMGTANGVLYAEKNNQFISNINLFETVTKKYPNSIDNERLSGGFYSTEKSYFVPLIYQNGLLELDKNWGLKKYHSSLFPNSADLRFKDFNAIYQRGNEIWVATHACLTLCDANLKPLRNFVPNVPNAAYGDVYFFTAIVPLDAERVLLRSLHSISIFNCTTKAFEQTFVSTKDQSFQLTDDYIRGVVIHNNSCFIATEKGLIELHLVSKKVQKIKLPIANSRLLCMTKFKDELVIGTQSGLHRYSIATQKVRSYYRKDGMASDNIVDIQTDGKNTIWIATASGLSQLDTKTNRIQNLYKKDGLADNLIEGGIFIDDANRIVVGSINYISIVNQKAFHLNQQPLRSIITEITINKKPYNWTQKEIKVAHNQNNIGIHFAVPNWHKNENHTYYYKIGKQWNSLNSGFIQLNSLSEGTYEIQVASQPTDHPNNDRIQLTILPPFYKTWWFYLLMAIGLFIVLYVFYKRRIQNLKNQKSYEEKIKDAEMKTLRSQMNPHFVFNTLNSINSYIIQNKTNLASDYLTTFSKLMRSILDLSKHESISLEKELKTLTFYLELEALRLEHKFDYSITVDNAIDQEFIKIPPLIVQPFVENAIWHGLHSKKESGMIDIKVREPEEDVLVISITDDGIGRKAAAMTKTKNTEHKSYGIAITIERLQLLNPKNQVQITDLYANDQTALGTKVELTLHLS
jgi:ligand-binding sensor domain-containing protein/two-component sensor histidine kinase